MNVNKYLASICLVSSMLSMRSLRSMDSSVFQGSNEVNAVDEDGYTKLHYACFAGKVEEVERLIGQGADVNIKTEYTQGIYNMYTKRLDPRIATPLDCAAMKGNHEIIARLLDAGADIDATYNIQDNTALHFATWFGHPDSVRLLVGRGASVHARNNRASTAASIAVWRNEPECLAILLEYGADAENVNKTGKSHTLFYLAATLGSVECLRILLQHVEYDKEIINQNSGQRAPLLAAAGMLRAQCCWDLIKAGACYSQEVLPSTKVHGYSALKNFLENIEQTSKPAYSNGAGKICLLCNHEFVTNDVIIQLNAWTSCGHNFHERCFQDSTVKDYIEKNRTSNEVIQLFKEYEALPFDDKKTMQLVEQSVRMDHIADPQAIKQCPFCKKPLSGVLGSLSVVC